MKKISASVEKPGNHAAINFQKNWLSLLSIQVSNHRNGSPRHTGKRNDIQCCTRPLRRKNRKEACVEILCRRSLGAISCPIVFVSDFWPIGSMGRFASYSPTMKTIKNQPFMQVNISFPWILRKVFFGGSGRKLIHLKILGWFSEWHQSSRKSGILMVEGWDI